MFVEVSHQGHDHHWVDSQDVPHPAVQNPVLQDEPRQQKKVKNAQFQAVYTVTHDR